MKICRAGMDRSWCLLSITGFSPPSVVQSVSILVMPRKIKCNASLLFAMLVTYLCVSSVKIKWLPDPAVNL
jgi:hypothetical protein